MSLLQLAGLSCLLAAFVSASPLPESSGYSEILVEGDVNINNPTIIDEVITTTVTVYLPEPTTSALTSTVASIVGTGSLVSSGLTSSINPGGPVVFPVYPYPNSSIPISGTGTAASSGFIATGSSLVWLSTGTAPFPRPNSTAPAPLGTGTGLVGTGFVGTGAGRTGAVGTGASSDILRSPSGDVIPPYQNTTLVSIPISAPPSGTAVSTSSASINSTTTFTVTMPAPASPTLSLPTSTPVTSVGPAIIPTPIITPTPTPTPVEPLPAPVASAYSEIERVIYSVVLQWFPFVTDLPGFSDLAAAVTATA